jgi:hypothetical protein
MKFDARHDDRTNVPAGERIKQLYIYGYDTVLITQIVNNEFEDLMATPFNQKMVEQVLRHNREELDALKEEYKLDCRGYLKSNHEEIFTRAANVEMKMVHVYETKLQGILDALMNLDVELQDEDGNYINTYRTNVLIELATKYQNMIGKLSGTDQLRDVEMFRKKVVIKKKVEGEGDSENNMIDVSKGVIDVKFIQ